MQFSRSMMELSTVTVSTVMRSCRALSTHLLACLVPRTNCLLDGCISSMQKTHPTNTYRLSTRRSNLLNECKTIAALRAHTDARRHRSRSPPIPHEHTLLPPEMHVPAPLHLHASIQDAQRRTRTLGGSPCLRRCTPRAPAAGAPRTPPARAGRSGRGCPRRRRTRCRRACPRGCSSGGSGTPAPRTTTAASGHRPRRPTFTHKQVIWREVQALPRVCSETVLFHASMYVASFQPFTF